MGRTERENRSLGVVQLRRVEGSLMFIRRPAGHLRSAVGRSSRSSGGGAARRGQRRGAAAARCVRGCHRSAVTRVIQGVGSSTRGEGDGGPLETRLVEKGFSLMVVMRHQESGPAGGKTGARRIVASDECCGW
jgi:hypothetical protein